MPNPTIYRSEIERGEQLLVECAPEQALRVFERVLEQDPENVDAMNDAGVACTCLDRSAEAVVHFEGALALAPGRADVFMNLVDTLLEAGELGKAKEAFVLHERGIPLSEEKERYRKALFPAAPARLSAAEGDGLPVAEGTLKVAFFCFRRDSFVLDLERVLSDRHEVKVLHFDYGKVDLRAVQEGLDWADVTWFEWCDQLLVSASRQLRKTSRVVCRLHSFEAFMDWPAQVRWDFVDHLVFVAPHLRRIFEDRFGLQTASSVIYNGVDLDKLTFRERTPSFDLAFVGDLNFKKNPELLLQCMADLVGRDPRYRLHIAGTFQELRYKLYYEKMIPALGLEEHVVFHGWVDDVDAWLEDKSYIVSTSVLESFGMSIAEGMAKGLKPVIHNWVGAEELYPQQVLFNTPAEFSRRVQAEDYDPGAYRQYITDYYALEEQVDKTDFLLRRLCQSGRGAAVAPQDGFPGTITYWERRYASGGNSGAGSYGRLAEFKAKVLNAFVEEHGIRSVVELGCGDGHQLSLARYPDYVGLDVSESALRLCKERFRGDPHKRFERYRPGSPLPVGSGELALSLDVLFHLVEEELYEEYLQDLFALGERFVIIYAYDTDEHPPGGAPHVKPRRFTDWIMRNQPGWKLMRHIPNDYPLEGNAQEESFSDFFVFCKDRTGAVAEAA